MRGKKEFDKQNDYNREKYDRVGLMLPKGKADEWRTRARAENSSLNAFVQKAVEFYIENCTERVNCAKSEE